MRVAAILVLVGAQSAWARSEAPPGAAAAGDVAAESSAQAAGEPSDDPIGVVIAAKLGGTFPTSGLSPTVLVELEAGYRLPWLGRLFGVGLGFSFGFPSAAGTVNASDAGGNVDYDVSQQLYVITLEGTAHRRFGDFSVHGAVGFGFYILSAEAEAFGMTNSESQSRTGFLVRGGAGYALGPGDVVAELRYHWVGLKFLSTGSSDAGGISLGAGYRLAF